jgi:outer membrane protein assembly factor BamA
MSQLSMAELETHYTKTKKHKTNLHISVPNGPVLPLGHIKVRSELTIHSVQQINVESRSDTKRIKVSVVLP